VSLLFSRLFPYTTLFRSHFMNEGLFQKNIGLEHSFEIVERLANQLVRLAVVDESFTHSALLRERASSTSIGGKIAIPHAQPETRSEEHTSELQSRFDLVC